MLFIHPLGLQKRIFPLTNVCIALLTNTEVNFAYLCSSTKKTTSLYNYVDLTFQRACLSHGDSKRVFLSLKLKSVLTKPLWQT